MDQIAAVFDRYAPGFSVGARRSLEQMIRRLPPAVADIESCGLPDTLVHGDFHPGNVRGVDGRMVILDSPTTPTIHGTVCWPRPVEPVFALVSRRLPAAAAG